MATCACGNVAHPTERLAAGHKAALERRALLWPRRHPLKVYQCVSGSWHVGHPERKQ